MALQRITPLLQQTNQTTADQAAAQAAANQRLQHLQRGAALGAPQRDGSVPHQPTVPPAYRQNQHLNVGQKIADGLAAGNFFQ